MNGAVADALGVFTLETAGGVEECVLFEGVQVGRHTKLRRCVVDKDVEVPTGIVVGFDRAADIARGFTVTETGITVIPKGARITK